MRYLTMDLEMADPILPSIGVIALVKWENAVPVDSEYFIINPDCEINLALKARHNISEAFFLKAPYFHEIWPQIAEKIQGGDVFCFYANRTITALKNRAMIDNLPFPDLNFFCTHSLANRTRALFSYKELNIPYFKRYFEIKPQIISDALASGKLLEKAANHFEVSYEDLFQKIGYAGGVVRNEKKTLYRAIKSEEGYLARFRGEDGIMEFAF